MNSKVIRDLSLAVTDVSLLLHREMSSRKT
jgi:hypothetical protein